jgi:integrase
VSQGFLKFVSDHVDGPLFYSLARRRKRQDRAKHKKPPYAQVRQRLAHWVRTLGVDDPHVQPNHAWRHTFKQIADRCGISERLSDYITGHAHKSVGASYGAPTLEDMAEALKKFPRYVVE